MPVRSPLLRELRRHRIPAWWQDAKLGIFVHWTPASVPAFAPVDMEIGELLQSGATRRARVVAVHRVVRELAALPRRARSRSTTARCTATGRTPRSRPTGKPGSSSGIPTRGRAVRRHRRALRRARRQAHGRLLPLADRRRRIPTGRAGTAAATSSASWPKPCAARGCGSASTTRAGSTGPSTTVRSDRCPTCSPRSPRQLSGVRRRAGARADRALPAERPVERHRVAVGRQAPLAAVRALLRRGPRWRGQRPVDAVEPAARRRAARARSNALIDAARSARRSATPASCRRSRPTSTCGRPEYAVFPDVQTQAVGVRARHGPQLRVQRGTRDPRLHRARRAPLVLADIVAKGGNLLLNVGPRGVDAQIPDEQLARLDWLGTWLAPTRRARSRPPDRGSRPGTTTAEGAECATPPATTTCSRSSRDAHGLGHAARRALDADDQRHRHRREGVVVDWTDAGTGVELVRPGADRS